MTYYISQTDVENSIEYFSNAGFDSDDMLFLFLLSKHFGVTASYPVTYMAGKLSDTQKKEYVSSLWMLSGLFDSSETCGKRGLMFPTAFRKMSAYQPGTEFSGILGRMKDTVEKKNHNVPIYGDNEGMLTLKSNYRDLIQDNYLHGNKISLSNLAAWVLRFTSFDFEIAPSDKQFTRVVEKTIRKFFKITKNDFLWLFENDLPTHRLSPSTSGITGSQIRAKFTFETGKEPDVSPIGSNTPQISKIEREVVNRYLAMNGDNPSDSDILDILKTKKQIVLTGVPGVGKSRYTQMLCANPFFAGNTKTIQFHASYSYEDFIGYETLESVGNGTKVVTHKAAFLEFVDEASKEENKEKNYLFVIDELNRGNIAEIFGETILALDRNYKVSLNRDYDGVKEFKLPENLYIVATMNTSDRNIAFLDLAIRRRFAFVPLTPNYDFLSEEVVLDDFDLGNVLRVINQRIIDTLKDTELVLGQSYFIPARTAAGYRWDFNSFKNQFNFVLLPTIKEYSFNDPSAVNSIVGENLGDGIQETDEFKAAFSAEFQI